MKRMDTESFEDYKARRAVSNKARKDINRKAKGGKIGSREALRDEQRQAGNGKIRGTYGFNLLAHFARVTKEAIERKTRVSGDMKLAA